VATPLETAMVRHCGSSGPASSDDSAFLMNDRFKKIFLTVQDDVDSISMSIFRDANANQSVNQSRFFIVA